MLQATQSGSSYGLGGGAGVGGTGDSQLVHNTVSMNNIYHLWKANSMVYQVGSDNTFQNDMYNGSTGTAVIGGINAAPTYAAGNGWQSEAGGQYALAPGSAGHDQGVRIANFNDHFIGAGPDVGAVEGGSSGMKFGLAAATASTSVGSTGTDVAPAGGSTGTGTTGTATGVAVNPLQRVQRVGLTRSQAPTTAVPSTTATNGSAEVSATLDSSSYAIAAGKSVTFTVRALGNGATPTGTINFKDGDVSIGGCSSVALSGGTATCTTSSLAIGTHAIRGYYSGDTTYGAGIAGPITQTVQ